MSQLAEHILIARQRLAEGYRRLRAEHRAGAPGRQVCAAIADLRDGVVRDLLAAARRREGLDEGGPRRAQVALVAHGGYGRRQVAPFSDVDLMLLYAEPVGQSAARLAERFFRDLFDAGLVVGHSVRTPEEACRLAIGDATVCTSLMDSRLLAGDRCLFDAFWGGLLRAIRRRGGELIAAIEKERIAERIRFGETVYLLEPHVKRSQGGLRDVQLVRWLGMARCGVRQPEQLVSADVLSEEDVRLLGAAAEFLLRVRNELHFHAGRASDVLTRAEQWRIAELFGYEGSAGMLPVEKFMRDYFRHTGAVARILARMEAAVPRRRPTGPRAGKKWRPAASGPRRHPAWLVASAATLRRRKGDWLALMDLVCLAAAHNKNLAPATWEEIRRLSAELPAEVPPEGWRRFGDLMGHTAGLGPLLRGLHDAGILERFIPAFGHARGLLQYNQYHKYTVDEHCIRAVELATELESQPGLPGRLYRGLRRKHLLHLALLIHDVGKGYPEEHRQVGLAIAAQVAAAMGLDEADAEVLKFLVHQHLLMDHLAFRRDISDERLVIRFAVQVGSPEVLSMLFVFTACDLAAAGPGAWTSWKADLLAELYGRAIVHLADEKPAMDLAEVLAQRRQAVRQCLGAEADEPWFSRQIDALAPADLTGIPPEQLADDLRLLRQLEPGDVRVGYVFQAETETIQFTVCTTEEVTPGIFHRLTGALTAKGLEILAAQIHTFSGSLVLDRFQVIDPDYTGPPPRERLEEVSDALRRSLLDPQGFRPKFRRLWQPAGQAEAARKVAQTRVQVDNSTSATCTILDIFAVDRPGLLYQIARTLFELGLSVWRAKVGTYFDQVVDAFYVTDQQGRKVEDEAQLRAIRSRLLDVIRPD